MLQEPLSPYEFDVIAQRNSTKSRLGTMKSGEPWLSQERDRDNFFFFLLNERRDTKQTSL